MSTLATTPWARRFGQTGAGQLAPFGTAMYQLYHGDCLDILPTLEAQSVDAVICDPPYGTTACKWDSVIPFEPMWKELKRVVKRHSAIVLFGSQPFTSALVMSNPKWFRYDWVWEKNRAANFVSARHQPLRMHESIIVFCQSQCTYNPIRETRRGQGVSRANRITAPSKKPIGIYGTLTGSGTGIREEKRYPSSIQKFNIDSSNQYEQKVFHPTQKPLALLEYLVRTYTNEGDVVLDFTMGSGTTGHACANTGRRFIGIEKDEQYYRVASDRIATAYDPLRTMEVA